MFDWDTQMTLLSVGLAASCAGGVCGDHLSPISDTTIMLLPAPTAFHLNHRRPPRSPTGITVAAVSFVSFIIAGIVQNAVVCMIIAIVLMIATLLVINYHRQEARRYLCRNGRGRQGALQQVRISFL